MPGEDAVGFEFRFPGEDIGGECGSGVIGVEEDDVEGGVWEEVGGGRRGYVDSDDGTIELSGVVEEGLEDGIRSEGVIDFVDRI